MQSLKQIKKLQEDISKLTNEEIKDEILILKSQINNTKAPLLGVIRQMKKIVLVRHMVDYLKELFKHIDDFNGYILYMYYLAVEDFKRSSKPTSLLLVGKMLKISKSIISTFEKERINIKSEDIHNLCYMGLGSMVKAWQDTAHAMADHQDIINTTIGKANKKLKEEYLFTINQLLQNDVQELQNDGTGGELKVEGDGSPMSD